MQANWIYFSTSLEWLSITSAHRQTNTELLNSNFTMSFYKRRKRRNFSVWMMFSIITSHHDSEGKFMRRRNFRISISCSSGRERGKNIFWKAIKVMETLRRQCRWSWCSIKVHNLCTASRPRKKENDFIKEPAVIKLLQNKKKSLQCLNSWHSGFLLFLPSTLSIVKIVFHVRSPEKFSSSTSLLILTKYLMAIRAWSPDTFQACSPGGNFALITCASWGAKVSWAVIPTEAFATCN